MGRIALRLFVFLLACCFIIGCGKDAEKPDPAADATPTEPGAKPKPATPGNKAKTPANATAGSSAEPIALLANATPLVPLKPVDVTEGKPLRAWTSTAFNAVPNADGTVVYFGSNDGVDDGKKPHLEKIEVATKKKVKDWEVAGPALELLVLSADGSAIALARDEAKAPGLIEIWDTATGKKRTKFQHARDKDGGFGNSLEGLALSPDGKTAVSTTGASNDQGEETYFGWSAETGKQLWKVSTMYAGKPCFSSDGKHVLCWYKKGPAILDATNGKVVQHFKTTDDGADCRVALSKDDKDILIHAADSFPDPEGWQAFLIKINRATGKRDYCIRTGGKHGDRMRIMGDGQHVALLDIVGNDTIIQIRKISDGSLRGCFRINQSCAGEDGQLFPDGKTIILDDKLYDISSLQ